MDHGSMPMWGIVLGLAAGMIGAPKYGGRLAVLVGAAFFAVGYVLELPSGATNAEYWATAAIVVGLRGAIDGAIWCGLWGLAGRALGKKLKAPTEGSAPTA